MDVERSEQKMRRALECNISDVDRVVLRELIQDKPSPEGRLWKVEVSYSRDGVSRVQVPMRRSPISMAIRFYVPWPPELVARLSCSRGRIRIEYADISAWGGPIAFWAATYNARWRWWDVGPLRRTGVLSRFKLFEDRGLQERFVRELETRRIPFQLRSDGAVAHELVDVDAISNVETVIWKNQFDWHTHRWQDPNVTQTFRRKLEDAGLRFLVMHDEDHVTSRHIHKAVSFVLPKADKSRHDALCREIPGSGYGKPANSTVEQDARKSGARLSP